MVRFVVKKRFRAEPSKKFFFHQWLNSVVNWLIFLNCYMETLRVTSAFYQKCWIDNYNRKIGYEVAWFSLSWQPIAIVSYLKSQVSQFSSSQLYLLNHLSSPKKLCSHLKKNSQWTLRKDWCHFWQQFTKNLVSV